MCRIVQIGLLNIDVHWWQDWRTLVRVTTHTRNVIYAETCPINYTVAMGLLHGEIAAAWCACRTPRLCRDMPRYAPVTPDRFYDNLVDNNLNSFHSDQRAQAKKIRIQKAWYGTGTISRLYTKHDTRMGGILGWRHHNAWFAYSKVHISPRQIQCYEYCKAQLRQGSGKDRQGMAPKAKGLKA